MKVNKKLKIILISIIILVIIIVTIILINNYKTKKELEERLEKINTLEITTVSGENIVTEYKNIPEENFFIKIPTTFTELDDDIIADNYYGNLPQVVYSNDDVTINVLINMTDDEMNNEQIKDYFDEMLTILADNSRIIYSDYYEVDNHNVGNIKYMSNSVDSKIYNNTIYFSYNNKLVLVSFNCTEQLQDEWQKVGDFIIESLYLDE